MVVNKKVTGKAKSMAVGLALGTAASLAVTVLGAAVTANMILSEKIATEAVGYAALFILLIAAVVGALVSKALIKRRRMLVCIGAGGIYYLSLLAITAVFFGGQYHGMGVTALVVFGGCGAVSLLGLRGEKKGKFSRKKYRFR